MARRFSPPLIPLQRDYTSSASYVLRSTTCYLVEVYPFKMSHSPLQRHAFPLPALASPPPRPVYRFQDSPGSHGNGLLSPPKPSGASFVVFRIFIVFHFFFVFFVIYHGHEYSEGGARADGPDSLDPTRNKGVCACASTCRCWCWCCCCRAKAGGGGGRGAGVVWW